MSSQPALLLPNAPQGIQRLVNCAAYYITSFPRASLSDAETVGVADKRRRTLIIDHVHSFYFFNLLT